MRTPVVAVALGAAAFTLVACTTAPVAEAGGKGGKGGAQCGRASWYAMTTRTASGEWANPSAHAAAHRTIPFGTKVEVENLRNGRTVVVRINDRGPFVRGRVIDVTKAAAAKLDFIGSGHAPVRITVADGSAALGGSC